MDNVMVSVVCTNYNKETWIKQALDSFIQQETDFAYEIIIVDDCSTDQSKEIIKNYASQYPKIIRPFFNEHNLGITKTWKKICKEAKGKYIARCDADDYWIDAEKLQKQVNFLESQEVRWCTTDFNIVDKDNKLLVEGAFSTGLMKFVNSYEEMLALKSFLMPSAWMVDKELMLEANKHVDDYAVDDTFNIQLELIQHSNLHLIPESLAAYRQVTNSDSRPQSEEKMYDRIERLKQTQLDYLAQNPPQNIKKLSQILLEQDARQEKRLYQMNRDIYNLNENLKDYSILVEELKEENRILDAEIAELRRFAHQLKEDNAKLDHQYNSVITSRRWTIPTKIINFFRRK